MTTVLTILDRYIARTVLGAALAALLVLLAIDAFFAFVGEMGDIGRGDYGLSRAMEYVALTLPRRAHDLFPTALLLGTLIGLGALAGRNELVVMRTAGVSVARITRSVLQAGLLLLLAAALLGEFVAPAAEQFAQHRRVIAQSQKITFRSDQGFWARDGDRFVNIRQIMPGGELRGIRVYEFDGQRLRVATRAGRAVHREGGWVLSDVSQSLVSEDGVGTVRRPRLDWQSLLDPEMLSVVVVKPGDLAARDLRRYIHYLEANGLDADRYRLAFWSHIAAPVSGLAMLVLAVPFVFGPLRRVGAGQRIVVGVMVGLGFYLINQILSHLAQVYGFNAPLAALTPPLVFLGIGLWGVRRVG